MATNEPATVPPATRQPTWRAMASVVIGLALAGGVTTASATPSAQSAGELPPVTISSTTLREGETVTISGTGCVDPDTGTGEGLVVRLIRPTDFGRGGIQNIVPMLTADVMADGTFQGSAVVEQPLFPDGAQTGIVDCRPRGEDDPTIAPLLVRPIDLVIEAPPLPDLTVAAGSTIDYELPCSIPDGGYGLFGIGVGTGEFESTFLSVRGPAPPASAPQKGDQVQLEVPADAPTGTYDATASCGVTQAGTSAYFAGFTVTITGAGETPAPAPAPTPDPAPAGAASPVAGAPTFTG